MYSSEISYKVCIFTSSIINCNIFKSTRKLSTDKKTPAVNKKSSVKKNSVGSEKKTVLKQTSSIDLSKPVQQRRKSSAGRKQSTEKQR